MTEQPTTNKVSTATQRGLGLAIMTLGLIVMAVAALMLQDPVKPIVLITGLGLVVFGGIFLTPNNN